MCRWNSSRLGPFAEGAALTAENPPGRTSPMELLAAAYASCVCGMVALILERVGHPAEALNVSAAVELDLRDGIAGIRMAVGGDVPGIASEEFSTIVGRAKDGCPVGKALAGVPTTLDVALTPDPRGAASPREP